MLKDFTYEDGEISVLAACTVKESALAQSFINELTEQVKEDNDEMLVTCFCLKDGEADIHIQSRHDKESVPGEKESKYLQADQACRVYEYLPEENRSVHYTTGGFGSDFRDEKEGDLHSFFPEKPKEPWTEDILFHLLSKYGTTPRTLCVTTLFLTDLRNFGMEEGEDD